MSFPCVGDASASPCGCAPTGWEEYHDHTWPEFWDYSGRIKWLTFSFGVPPLSDKLVTASSMQWALEQVFFEYLHEGQPLRMCFMNKADRVAGIPVWWNYQVYVEFHESPLIQITAVMGALGLVLAIVVAGAVTLRLINSGVIEKIGGNIIVPSIVGLGMVFILGIGFIFVLANYMPGLRATVQPPEVPGMRRVTPVTEVSVGAAPTAARRRR